MSNVRFSKFLEQKTKEAMINCDNVVKTLGTIPIKDRQIPLFKMIDDLNQTCQLLIGCWNQFKADNTDTKPDFSRPRR